MQNIAETMEEAMRHHQHGHVRQAEELYRQVLRSGSDNPFALHSLGMIAYQEGKHDVALGLIKKAIERNPQAPHLHNTLAIVLEALSRFDEAVDAYKQAILLKPDYAEAYHNMGIALQSQGRYADAIEKCKQAVLLKPDYAEAYNTIGYAQQMLGQHADAVGNYRQAVLLKPDYAEAYNHLGVTLNTLGRYEEAIDNYRQAIQIDPDYAETHWNLSLVLLLTGRLTEGFKEYEWRKHPDLEMTTYPHDYELPQWDGSSFAGRRLLVHYEQGLGDTLHFVRYLPMVKARGGTVILEVRKPLHALLQYFPGIDELVVASYRQRPAVQFDFHTSLLDLPGIFRTTLQTIPAKVPYVHADSQKAQFWGRMLSGDHFKVGIVWSGSPTYERNHIRSCNLEDFAPLAHIDAVRLYSLQKSEAAAQIEALAGQIPVVNLGEQFEDFTDTAAAIENLDLLISTDTSVLHLAGAMAKPAWALISFAHDWRWLLDQRDSPWYPTMSLVRQTEADRWDTVFQQVAEKLRALVAEPKLACPEVRT